MFYEVERPHFGGNMFKLNFEKIKEEYRSVDMKPSPLFDEDGDDSFTSQMLVGGKPSGIINMNTVRHQWAVTIFNKMWSQFWQPQFVDMSPDKLSVNQLTKHELQAHYDTISFLAFMDSFQQNNLPNLFEYCTSPMVKSCGSVQEAFEAMHTQAYQYSIEATVPLNMRDSIYNRWKENPLLKHRIKTMTELAEKFKADPTFENYYILLMMNYILEGKYFYQGFNYYDQLAHRGKLTGTSKQIDYIRRDELSHMGLFIHKIKELGVDDELAHKMFMWAFKEEEKWNHAVYGDNILGMSKKSQTQYGKWLCNDRLARLGVAPLFENVENPYIHLEQSSQEGSVRESFFETTVTSYDTAGSIDGWDDV